MTEYQAFRLARPDSRTDSRFGTLVSFRVGASDAKILEEELGTFEAEHFTNLEKYHVYLKLMIDGIAGDAFSAKTLPPCEDCGGNEEKVVRVSRERYSKPRKEVEEKIQRWSN